MKKIYRIYSDIVFLIYYKLTSYRLNNSKGDIFLDFVSWFVFLLLIAITTLSLPLGIHLYLLELEKPI